ncbi:MAG: FkbM family methyltransferase [Nitrosomonadales bacterium]|nr:FkbM family methyltransferase [Nitrosomonadales bacterium]
MIDIGANYGVYTLSMAAIAGLHGHVWAFEPAASTAAYLQRSIHINRYENVTLIQAALSDHVGTARLSLNQNSELNSLTGSIENSENVALTTLDQAMQQYRWEDIAFVKLDAEGEESNILKGGVTFFERTSPLVMFEVKHGSALNLPLIRLFENSGYATYRLIPGLDVLAPFSMHEQLDPSQLNLFCCKADRAQKLESSNWLSRSPLSDPLRDENWKETLTQLPCMQSLPIKALPHRESPGSEEYGQALAYFFSAHNSEHSPGTRLASLHQSLLLLRKVCDRHANLPRLCSLSRVAWEYGLRSFAVNVIAQALALFQSGGMRLEEQFLPSSERFDTIPPGNNLAEWMLASLLEQGELLRAFSSYHTGQASLGSLRRLNASGFQSEQIAKRIRLIEARFGNQAV